MTGPEQHAATIERAWTENTDAPDGMPRCGECGRLLHSDSHTPGCHVPAAKAALDALVAQAERPGVEVLPDGNEIDWKGDATYAVEQMQAWRERAEAAEERASQLEHERDEAMARADRYANEFQEHLADDRQARREADQLRAALEEIEWHDNGWASKLARAALAGVQAKELT